MLLIKIWNLSQSYGRTPANGKSVLNALAFSLQQPFADKPHIGRVGVVFPQDMLPTESLKNVFVEVSVPRKATGGSKAVKNDMASRVGAIVEEALPGMNVVCIVREVDEGDGFWQSK